jgi:hypothetical protein
MSLSAKKIFYGIALTIAAIAFWGCSQPVDPPVDITWTAEADGAGGTTTSTKINLTFAGAVTGLTAEQITLTNGTGTATKGAVSGDGANWSLGLAVETAGDLTLAIDKTGVESGTKTVTVHKQVAAQNPGDETADPEDETTDPEDETAELTGKVKLLQGEGDEWATGIISGEGAAQTMTLAVVEEPLAYFAIEKTAAQTIAVSNDGGNKVTQAEEGGTLGGETASDIFALFAVNMEDLLFDGAFGESGSFNADAIPMGTETRAFTLTVSEEGKDPRTIAVSLNITLDQTTETSIYHREGTPGNYYYVKVRNPTLTEDDKIVYQNIWEHSSTGNVTYGNPIKYTSIEAGPVTNLQNAFAWVDRHAEPGTGNAGFSNGTTEGYSEYRLFMKKSQQIGKMGIVFINTWPIGKYGASATNQDAREYMSIELYGAGPSGSKEQKITRADTFTTVEMSDRFNALANGYGFISTLPAVTTAKYTALVLGKNITIDAEGSASANYFHGSQTTTWSTLAVTSLINLYNSNSMLIMNEHSKLTGCYDPLDGYGVIDFPIQGPKFYMKGGEITGNVIHHIFCTPDTNDIIISGGSITNNVTINGNISTMIIW